MLLALVVLVFNMLVLAGALALSPLHGREALHDAPREARVSFWL